MCGLVGFIGTGSGLEIAKNFLIASGQRGIHATGYVEIDSLGKYYTDKKAVSPYEFVKNFNYKLKNVVTFLGHTRHATYGKATSDRLAHPFNGTRFIVFHNGTITKLDWRRVQRFLNIKSRYSDSVLFQKFLDKFECIEKLKEEFLGLLSEESAYALVIYDKYSREVHFLKNDKRPLCYLQTPEGFFYASTPEILLSSIDRKYLKSKDISKMKIVIFPHNYHLIVKAKTGEIIKGANIKNQQKLLELDHLKGYKVAS